MTQRARLATATEALERVGDDRSLAEAWLLRAASSGSSAVPRAREAARRGIEYAVRPAAPDPRGAADREPVPLPAGRRAALRAGAGRVGGRRVRGADDRRGDAGARPDRRQHGARRAARDARCHFDEARALLAEHEELGSRSAHAASTPAGPWSRRGRARRASPELAAEFLRRAIEPLEAVGETAMRPDALRACWPTRCAAPATSTGPAPRSSRRPRVARRSTATRRCSGGRCRRCSAAPTRSVTRARRSSWRSRPTSRTCAGWRTSPSQPRRAEAEQALRPPAPSSRRRATRPRSPFQSALSGAAVRSPRRRFRARRVQVDRAYPPSVGLSDPGVGAVSRINAGGEPMPSWSTEGAQRREVDRPGREPPKSRSRQGQEGDMRAALVVALNPW